MEPYLFQRGGNTGNLIFFSEAVIHATCTFFSELVIHLSTASVQ